MAKEQRAGNLRYLWNFILLVVEHGNSPSIRELSISFVSISAGLPNYNSNFCCLEARLRPMIKSVLF